jgi:predicted nuclease of predicted toxin-antitoxin system
MKFIIDAHLPKSLCLFLKYKGYDAIHTLDLPEQNETDDIAISVVSMSENRVVVTKDSDFWDSFVLKRVPYKLLLVKVGNMSTADLQSVFSEHLSQIITALNENDVVILRKDIVETTKFE